MKEVIIDGIVYVPKEADKDDNSTPSFKVGDWVRVVGNLRRILRIKGDNHYLEYGFNTDHQDEGKLPFTKSELLEEGIPTPEEIETYLIAEAEGGGFKKGVS